MIYFIFISQRAICSSFNLNTLFVSRLFNERGISVRKKTVNLTLILNTYFKGTFQDDTVTNGDTVKVFLEG
jgi:hypothetical protein